MGNGERGNEKRGLNRHCKEVASGLPRVLRTLYHIHADAQVRVLDAFWTFKNAHVRVGMGYSARIGAFLTRTCARRVRRFVLPV